MSPCSRRYARRDFVGRYGGEQFILPLPDADGETVVKVAERVRKAIANTSVPGGDSAVTARLGVAVFPEDAPDAARLLRKADRALYRAKANDRTVEVFALDPTPRASRTRGRSPRRHPGPHRPVNGRTAAAAGLWIGDRSFLGARTSH